MHVRLRNFQAWSDAQIDLKGLTILVGPSGLGKSSFGRAIRRSLRNEVLPGDIKLKAPKVEIDLLMHGLDLHVERGSKAKDSTIYKVGDKVYEKLGGDIPQEVKDMAFGPVEVNGVSIDPLFAGQFDGQFLVGAKPAELNAVLNAFASTEKLDRGRKILAGVITDANAQAKALAPQISNLEEQEAALKDTILSASASLELSNAMALKVKRLERARVVLTALIASTDRIMAAKGAIAELARVETMLATAIKGYKAPVRVQVVADSKRFLAGSTRQIQALGKVDGLTATPIRLTKALRAIQAKLQGSLLEMTAQARVQRLEALAAPLNRSLVTYKALIRIKALGSADPEATRALALQIHELPLGLPKTLLSAGIIVGKLKTSYAAHEALCTQLGDLALEMSSNQSEHADLQAQIDTARHAGTLVTCPKCGTEFTPSHSH